MTAGPKINPLAGLYAPPPRINPLAGLFAPPAATPARTPKRAAADPAVRQADIDHAISTLAEIAVRLSAHHDDRTLTGAGCDALDLAIKLRKATR